MTVTTSDGSHSSLPSSVFSLSPFWRVSLVRFLTVPGKSVLLAERRTRSLSVSPPDSDTPSRCSPSLVIITLAVVLLSAWIGVVVMLIAPAMALLPNSVLCGPFSTSTRLTSVRSLNEAAWYASGMSSTMTATSDSTPIPNEKVPMPRMLMLLLAGWVL